jgi:hypothetical protein
MYPASGFFPGQDGDTRVPVLIKLSAKLSASSAIFLKQVSRTPFDCQAISLPPLANVWPAPSASDFIENAIISLLQRTLIRLVDI